MATFLNFVASTWHNLGTIASRVGQKRQLLQHFLSAITATLAGTIYTWRRGAEILWSRGHGRSRDLEGGHDFKYTPIGRGQIRLLRFLNNQESADSGDTVMRCVLEHFEQDKAPPYYAISYAWGDRTKCQSVCIDHASVGITHNLFEALNRVHRITSGLLEPIQAELGAHQASQLYVWADGICLDQQNESEIEAQVPLMGQVFGKAFNVFVWLGESQGISEELSTRGGDLLKKLERESPSERRTGLETMLKVLTPVLSQYPWFSRLWVVQEYALSQREPWVEADYGKVDLELFKTFISECLKQKPIGERSELLGDLPAAAQLALPFISDFMSSTSRDLKPSTFQHLAVFDRLEYVLLRKGIKKSERRHDQIYAFLGLADATNLSAELKPDYKKDFMEVAEVYTRHIFQQTGSLALLGNRDPEINDSVPSWVSDFDPIYLASAQNIKREFRQSNIQFPDNTKELILDGVTGGLVISSTPPVPNDNRDLAIESVRHVWETMMPMIAEKAGRTVEELWRESVDNMPKVIGLVTPFETLQDFLKALEDTEHPAHLAAEMSLGLYKQYGFALLEDGTFLFYWPPHRQFGQSEHIAVMFVGAISITILEKLTDEKFRCVAQAELASDLVQRQPRPFIVNNPDFFAPARLQRFTLR